MGVWGTGLYSGDLAQDLRSTISAVAKLPYSGTEIVQLLVEENPQAVHPDDEEYTEFWLVVADQLHRKSIESPATARALEIIESGRDLEVMKELEMTPGDLRKRAAVLDKLRDTLTSPLLDKPRRTLAKPQPLIFAPGDVFRWQVDVRGNPPLFLNDPEFTQVGWGAAVVLEVGHEFEYLAGYRIARLEHPVLNRPSLEDVAHGELDTNPYRSGVFSRSEFRRTRCEILGTVPVPADYPPDAQGGSDQPHRSRVLDGYSIAESLCYWLSELRGNLLSPPPAD